MSDSGGFLEGFVEPWYNSLKNPEEAQALVLETLIDTYVKTDYGKKYGLDKVSGIEAYRSSLPVVKYFDLKPWIDKVMNGQPNALLDEPVVNWAMTRGTTGISKVIPVTNKHISNILFAGARGIINFALRKNEMDVVEGAVLNLNFPSVVMTINTSLGPLNYGYSSGTYAKLLPELGSARLVPKQEEIDALGGGISKKDWDDRFELVYQKSKDAPIRSLMGVTPVLTAFAKYVKKNHGILPKDLWQLKAVFCTSVAKIQTNYAPYIRRLFGEAPVVEMYSATEGVFAQQLDDHPYVSPNYDVYLFEVITGNRIKMLHELKKGEWGRLVVSTSILPRYAIGDLIESTGKGYFRVFGRDKPLTVLEHLLFNISTGTF